MYLQQQQASTKENMLARYQRAQILEAGVFTKNVAFNTTIYPHWIGDSDCFWYLRQTRDGQTYRLVDAKAESNNTAFDHKALATALTQASGQNALADNLPLMDLDLSQAPEVIRFSAFGKHWEFTAENNLCEAIDIHPADWKMSPDGKQAMFVRDYNLWVRDLEMNSERALTSDGEKFYRYASTPTVYGRQEMVTLEAIWSPDSNRIFTQVLDTRDVAIAPPIIEHVPADGSLRPNAIDPDRRMAVSSDEQIEAYRFLSIDVKSATSHFIDYHPCPVFRPPYVGYFTSRRGWWDADNRTTYRQG